MKTNSARTPGATTVARDYARGAVARLRAHVASNDNRLLAVLALVAAIAFVGGRWTASDNWQFNAALKDARAELQEQQRVLDRLARQRELDVNAASVRLAELQAVATRLDALGGRIVELAQIDADEFSFDAQVPVGGPEQLLSPATANAQVDEAIDVLSTRLRRQSAQLDTLQELLLGRRLEDARRPSGWPVLGGWISSGFGERTDPFTGRRSHHAGVDIAGPLNAEVLSVADGIVIWAGTREGFGKTVDIDHGNGYVTRYAHNSELDVEVGDTVTAGQRIGRMGSSGRASGQHVHFEVRRDGMVVNPANFLKDSG